MTRTFLITLIVLTQTAGLLAPGVASPTLAQPDDAQIDLTRLPIGDGRISTGPTQGAVWRCGNGGPANGGGAFRDGPWIHPDGTYDLTSKAIVDGDMFWASDLAISDGATTRRIVGNGLPSHPTGVYPIVATDDAYRYDRNPNSVRAQRVDVSVPLNPAVAAQTSCLAPGPIAVLLTGAVVFDALDAERRDAVAHEVQDRCQGHPERTGSYHYHSLPVCLEDPGDGHSALMGYAMDGFGLYGHRGEDGRDQTTADLDACHGHTHVIEWNGALLEQYHYHATWEYPYTLGCFRGAAPRGGPGR